MSKNKLKQYARELRKSSTNAEKSIFGIFLRAKQWCRYLVIDSGKTEGGRSGLAMS